MKSLEPTRQSGVRCSCPGARPGRFLSVKIGPLQRLLYVTNGAQGVSFDHDRTFCLIAWKHSSYFGLGFLYVLSDSCNGSSRRARQPTDRRNTRHPPPLLKRVYPPSLRRTYEHTRFLTGGKIILTGGLKYLKSNLFFLSFIKIFFNPRREPVSVAEFQMFHQTCTLHHRELI